MLPVVQLINAADSALPFVTESASAVPGRCIVHPPSEASSDVLHRTQVTTRSPMGAIAYHTGGITILNGWLRILGSGPSNSAHLAGLERGMHLRLLSHRRRCLWRLFRHACHIHLKSPSFGNGYVPLDGT